MSAGGSDRTAEGTGETVGEARWAALHELERRFADLDRGAVTFTVLSEGERGLLGVGYEPARVLALYGGTAERPLAVSAGTPTGELACEVVRRVLSGLRLPAQIALAEEPERVVVTVDGPDLGLLIGKHGATIDALQYLLNAMAHRALESPAEVVVDAQGYRARRERTLTDVADRAAERVRETGQPVDLEAMIAGERKVVHLHLKATPDVRTESDGREPNRFVRVLPA